MPDVRDLPATKGDATNDNPFRWMTTDEIVSVVGMAIILATGVVFWLLWYLPLKIANDHHATALAAVAGAATAIITLLGVAVTGVYVVLTYGLWRNARAQLATDKKAREGGLALQMMVEYDKLRHEILTLILWAHPDPVERVRIFRDEQKDARALAQPYNIDEARYAVSRSFVQIRKLVRAGYLSEGVVVAALDERAIREVFLDLVDGLDAATSKHYDPIDRNFYTALLERYRN